MATSAGKQALPHRPHLTHLRKQAKARLREMRATQPDARLADAQRLLAQEYGFSTWGKLRAEVFRRVGAPRGHHFRARRRRTLLAIGYRERDHRDSLLEPPTPAESETAFFLCGAATNIGVLFVLIAILMSVGLFAWAVLPDL